MRNKAKRELTQKQEKVDVENHEMEIDCKSCSQRKNSFYNDQCISCISFNFFQNIKKKISKINLKSHRYMMNETDTSLFLEYHSKLDDLEDLLNKITELREKCAFSNFKCKVLDNSFLEITQSINFYNPILIYQISRDHHLNVKNLQFEYVCRSCIKKIQIYLEQLLDILTSTELIQNYVNFCKKRNLYGKYSNFYEFMFSKINLHPILPEDSLIEKEKNELIETYSIGKHNLYTISIFNRHNEREKIYSFKTYFENTSNEDYYERIINFITNKIDLMDIDTIISLEKLIESYQLMAIKKIDQEFDIENVNKSRIGLLIALKILNLEKLFALLIDNEIEEIFLDSPLDTIYLNHQKYGRCRTHLKLTVDELERIITMLRLYSGQRLDYSNPNLKMILKNKYFYCRFAVDIAPINVNNYSLDIRKLNKDIFTVQDLLKNNTLNPEIAAFLYFCLIKRQNITVSGKTDSGKTTLINAFDLLTPKEFRKVYVESVVESLDLIKFGKHQLKFKVESLDNHHAQKSYTKSNQIKTLLHRTPDIIFLGEILTKEETEAMFHCLAAGLKGFQTIHANDMNSLINRFLYHFNINKSCLNDLDLIILMKKDEKYKRQIFSISEIFLNDQEKIILQDLIKYNPNLDKWEISTPLYESQVIKNLCKYESLDKEKFKSLMNTYVALFTSLLKMDKIKLEDFINLFHKISYLSLFSPNILDEYCKKLNYGELK